MYTFNEQQQLLARLNVSIRGILHIGACVCDEKAEYNEAGFDDDRIYWVEGNRALVNQMQKRGIPHMYHALIDKEEKEVEFHIASNRASSSILEFGTHAELYKEVTYINDFLQTTITLEHFFQENKIPIEQLNYWCLDIQGNELSALQSAGPFLQYADALWCEVNYEYVYKNCGLLTDLDAFLAKHGFVRFETRIETAGQGNALYVRVPAETPESAK